MGVKIAVTEKTKQQSTENEKTPEPRYFPGFSQFWAKPIAIPGVIMAAIVTLGQYSGAVSVIANGLDSLRSTFTHTVEYELLDQVHVSNTESYIESLLGNPQVSRAINDDIVANYFYNDKFLLTVFIKDSRVAAYTIIPLLSDFAPIIIENSGLKWILQESTYSKFPANPKTYLVDHSKTTSYYLESLDTGRAGLFVQNYLGNVSLTSTQETNLHIDLYDREVNGTDEEILKSQTRLREMSRPNLFGMGTLTLELVQKSILTGAEFTSFFGP